MLRVNARKSCSHVIFIQTKSNRRLSHNYYSKCCWYI